MITQLILQELQSRKCQVPGMLVSMLSETALHIWQLHSRSTPSKRASDQLRMCPAMLRCCLQE